MIILRTINCWFESLADATCLSIVCFIMRKNKKNSLNSNFALPTKTNCYHGKNINITYFRNTDPYTVNWLWKSATESMCLGHIVLYRIYINNY